MRKSSFGSRCVGELLDAASGDWFVKTGSLSASNCRNTRWPHPRKRVDQVALLSERISASRQVRQMRLLPVYSLGGRGLKGADDRPEIAKTEIFVFPPKVILSSDCHAPRISDRIGSRKGSLDSSRGSGVTCEERSSNGSAAVEISRPQVLAKAWKTVKTVLGRTFEGIVGFSRGVGRSTRQGELFRTRTLLRCEDVRSGRSRSHTDRSLCGRGPQTHESGL